MPFKHDSNETYMIHFLNDNCELFGILTRIEATPRNPCTAREFELAINLLLYNVCYFLHCNLMDNPDAGWVY